MTCLSDSMYIIYPYISLYIHILIYIYIYIYIFSLCLVAINNIWFIIDAAILTTVAIMTNYAMTLYHLGGVTEG